MHLGKGRIPVIVLSLCGLAAQAMGNLAANGNFAGGTYVDPASGDVLPVSWSLSPPTPANLTNVNVISALPGYVDPDGGSVYVAFRSTADTTQDCLNQFIPTIAGDTYTISFYAAMTASAVSNTFLTAEWVGTGTNDKDVQIFSASSGPATNGFLQFIFTETANLSSTQFYFHGTDSSGAILVADLVVTQDGAVPEPASLLLSGAGLGILAALARYARRDKA